MLSGAGSVVVLMVTALKTQKHYSVSEMNLGVQVCTLVQYLSTMMFPLKGAGSLFLSWALVGEVVIKVHADDVPLRRISKTWTCSVFPLRRTFGFHLKISSSSP